VSFNTTAADGGLGQYIIGTFVADSTGSQEIDVTAGVNSYTPVPQINGLQLRHFVPITWGTPLRISGDSDVQTNGTVFAAYTFGSPAPPSVTVNGILFSPFLAPGVPTVTVGNLTLSTTGGATVNGHTDIFGSGSAPFASLSSAYQTLLSSDANTTTMDVPAPLTVTIGGLTLGQKYQVELWTNDSRGNNRFETLTGINPPTLGFDLNGEGGEVGQFVIGTWTATSTTQTFMVTGTPGSFVSQINALEILALTQKAVITGVMPGSLPFGGPSTLITINGTGFLPGASVKINGVALTTTYVSSTQLKAQVVTNNLLAPSPLAVTVTNSATSVSAPFSLPLLEPSIQLSFTTARDPSTNLVHVYLTFNNTGGGYALNAVLGQVMIGTISATSPAFPTPPNTLPPGAKGTIDVTFPGSALPPGANVLKVGGSYTGGSFNAAFRITVP
jgi:hypothetical protein